VSAVTDRQTPEDIDVIAAILFNVRQRLARKRAAAAAEQGNRVPGDDHGEADHHDGAA
jgi:hypothetical protein